MELENIKPIIEAILFSAGKEVSIKELKYVFEISEEKLREVIFEMKEEYSKSNRGIEIIEINDSVQLCSKKEFYEYIYQIIDKRNKPKLSQAAIETLAIIAYNPKITRAEIEAIRGVSSDAVIYKLLDYNLIEEAGKLDLLGKPMSYRTTNEFLKLFGISKLEELPELPRYKIDSNQQIVLEDLLIDETKKEENEEETSA